MPREIPNRGPTLMQPLEADGHEVPNTHKSKLRYSGARVAQSAADQVRGVRRHVARLPQHLKSDLDFYGIRVVQGFQGDCTQKKERDGRHHTAQSWKYSSHLLHVFLALRPVANCFCVELGGPHGRHGASGTDE